MYIHSEDDDQVDPLTQHLGELANAAAEHYQSGRFVAAACELGELQAHTLEHLPHAWAHGIVDWLTDALELCECAAARSPHFRFTIDELEHYIGRTEPRCERLGCDAVAGHATVVEVAGDARTSHTCGDHLEMIANVILQDIGSSIQMENRLDAAHL